MAEVSGGEEKLDERAGVTEAAKRSRQAMLAERTASDEVIRPTSKKRLPRLKS